MYSIRPQAKRCKKQTRKGRKKTPSGSESDTSSSIAYSPASEDITEQTNEQNTVSTVFSDSSIQRGRKRFQQQYPQAPPLNKNQERIMAAVMDMRADYVDQSKSMVSWSDTQLTSIKAQRRDLKREMRELAKIRAEGIKQQERMLSDVLPPAQRFLNLMWLTDDMQLQFIGLYAIPEETPERLPAKLDCIWSDKEPESPWQFGELDTSLFAKYLNPPKPKGFIVRHGTIINGYCHCQ